MIGRFAVAGLASVAFIVLACGKKGPPLPPLVRVPVPPANVTAERRGDAVDLSLTVPDANTDRTKPANIERVDVYAITAPANVTDDQLLKRGTKVASIDVKSPRDQNDIAPEDQPQEEPGATVGAGLDQGAAAHVTERLTPQAFAPADLGKLDREARKAAERAEGPLIGPPQGVPARTYAAVGVTPRGRRGPFSRRATAPLIPPPPAPAGPEMMYTEREITISWRAADGASAGENVLPSRPLGASAPSRGYNVYDVSSEPRKINTEPVAATTFTDKRMTWGENRCYAVRAVISLAGTTIESDPSARVCETLTDTFAPAAPKGLRSVGGERTISLIWDPNTEPDLAGYLVFRGTGGELQPMTAAPIQDTTFSDAVQPGFRFVYAVKAVDKAGNVSPFSERVEETARE